VRLFSLYVGERDPLSLLQNPALSVSVPPSGNRRRWWKSERNTPLEYMVKNFKKGFNGDYGVNS
jgi:hypothetical protein